LNRFTSDISVLDNLVSVALIDAFEGVVGLLGFLINVFILNYYLLIPAFVSIFFMSKFAKPMAEFTMDSRRLELQERAPIYNFLMTTVNGILPIKLYNMHDRIENIYNIFLQNLARCNYNYMKSFRTSAFCLEFFAVCFQISSIYILINTINLENTGKKL
jgi:ABC-type multidrug transport system fused ATPase/permease subunit